MPERVLSSTGNIAVSTTTVSFIDSVKPRMSTKIGTCADDGMARTNSRNGFSMRSTNLTLPTTTPRTTPMAVASSRPTVNVTAVPARAVASSPDPANSTTAGTQGDGRGEKVESCGPNN